MKSGRHGGAVASFCVAETLLTQCVIMLGRMIPLRLHRVSADPPSRRVLVDGTRVVLRPIAPSDAPRLHAAFHALSPESRYLRFLGHLSDLSPEMLRYLCEVDGYDHVAYIASRDVGDASGPREGDLVGVARFVRARDEMDSAEIAITVADELHGLGLGTLLLEALANAAKTRDISRFTAVTLRENRAMRRVLAHGGPTTLLGDDTLELRLREPF
jgi:RimJ/RimL family protein N-acetyltransferase